MSDKIVQLKDKDGTAIFPLSAYGSTEFVGAGASTAGTKGIVPAPAAGDQNKFLKADGTWAAAVSYETATGSNVNPDERYAPLEDTYSYTINSTPDCDDLVFIPKDYAATSNHRITETRISNASMNGDPIATTTTHYGTCKTLAYADSSNIHFEQWFTKKQTGNQSQRYEFYRKGMANNVPASGSGMTVNWQEWIPIEYPRTQISTSWVESGFTIHSYSYFVINGGIATISLNEIKHNTAITSSYTKAITFPFKFKNDGYMYLMAFNESSGAVGTYRINMDARNEIGCYNCQANTIYRPYWQIPLGY